MFFKTLAAVISIRSVAPPMRLPLSEIRPDETVQPRVELDRETVSDYADAVRRGDEFPPVVVFKDTDGVNWLADGFHRFHAHVEAQAEYIAVDIKEGTYRDARFYAIRANAKNARRYTNADKRKIALTLLSDPEMRRLTNAAIAEDIAVGAFTAAFFGSVRTEWESQNGLGNPIRACRDGRELNTTRHVGPKKSAGSLLDAINFVMPAVSKKDFVPALAHLHIRDGRILGYDGALAASSPVAPDVPTCSPLAATFAKAIREATGPVKVEIVRSGVEASDAGGMTTHVPTLEEAHPNIEPEGTLYEAIPDLLKAFETLEPFIATDASRPWSRGVLLKGTHAYATDTVIAVEVPQLFPVKVNLPVEAVRFILRTRHSPTSIQVNADSITFHFPGERWLRSQLLSTDWPDVAAALPPTDRCVPVPEGFFAALERLAGESVHFQNGYVVSSPDPWQGIKQRLPGANESWGRHDRKRILKLKDRAASFDLSMYPAPCPFQGRDGLRGVIVGRTLDPEKTIPSFSKVRTPSVAGVPPWEVLDLEQFAQRHDLEVHEIDGEQVALVREADLAKFR